MKIEVFGATWCKPCRDTKKLLEEKGLEFTFLDVDETTNQQEFHNRTGSFLQTIPQVFIDNKHIGGREELIKYLG